MSYRSNQDYTRKEAIDMLCHEKFGYKRGELEKKSNTVLGMMLDNIFETVWHNVYDAWDQCYM